MRETLLVSSMSLASDGVAMKRMLMRPLAEYPLECRGSLMSSASHLPPFGLKISTS
jgi:hypothetical protein